MRSGLHGAKLQRPWRLCKARFAPSSSGAVRPRRAGIGGHHRGGGRFPFDKASRKLAGVAEAIFRGRAADTCIRQGSRRGRDGDLQAGYLWL